jgi:putative protease
MPEKQIGKVTHWYDKIGVAVLDLSGTLRVGDKVKIKRGDQEFETVIESMQVDHEEVDSAKKGDEVAVKLPEKAREGALIFLEE